MARRSRFPNENDVEALKEAITQAFASVDVMLPIKEWKKKGDPQALYEQWNKIKWNPLYALVQQANMISKAAEEAENNLITMGTGRTKTGTAFEKPIKLYEPTVRKIRMIVNGVERELSKGIK